MASFLRRFRRKRKKYARFGNETIGLQMSVPPGGKKGKRVEPELWIETADNARHYDTLFGPATLVLPNNRQAATPSSPKPFTVTSVVLDDGDGGIVNIGYDREIYENYQDKQGTTDEALLSSNATTNNEEMGHSGAEARNEVEGHIEVQGHNEVENHIETEGQNGAAEGRTQIMAQVHIQSEEPSREAKVPVLEKSHDHQYEVQLRRRGGERPIERNDGSNPAYATSEQNLDSKAIDSSSDKHHGHQNAPSEDSDSEQGRHYEIDDIDISEGEYDNDTDLSLLKTSENDGEDPDEIYAEPRELWPGK